MAKRSGQGNAKSARRKSGKAGERIAGFFPEIAWLYWLVPRRRQPLFKIKLLIALLAAAFVGRAAYVHVRSCLAIEDLRSAGYIPDASYSVPHSRRWIHGSDPKRPAVTFFRYPRPESSPFERMDESMKHMAIERRDSWRGRAVRTARIGFLYASAPFLMPIDSRTGFDPFSEANENAEMEELLKQLTSGSKSREKEAERR